MYNWSWKYSNIWVYQRSNFDIFFGKNTGWQIRNKSNNEIFDCEYSTCNVFVINNIPVHWISIYMAFVVDWLCDKMCIVLCLEE